jgi:KUP system potassium uptake protein
VANPGIFAALNPLNAFNFLLHTELHTLLLVMGSVMLVVTGGEAMYADMGHFGRKPIQISWFSLVYPMLVFNYLGQGAFLLSKQAVINNNVFYSMVPGNFLIPMVILATAATVIASQALISGAFSLVSQAVALGLLPRIRIIQTHHEHEGQKYIPTVNWALYFGAVTLVIIFGSSSRLASLYGFAVAGDMTIASLAFLMVSRYVWKWQWWKVLAAIGPFLVIDPIFFAANSLKLFQGGYIPLGVALVVMVIMMIWNWGKSKSIETERRYKTMSFARLAELKDKSEEFLPRTMVVLTPEYIDGESDHVPVLEQLFWDRYGMLPHNLIFLTVVQHKLPYMHSSRYEIEKLYHQPNKGNIFSVKMNFGFMEEPDVEKQLEKLIKHEKLGIAVELEDVLVQYVEDEIVVTKNASGFKKWVAKMFKVMDRNTMSAVQYFGLDHRVKLSSEFLQVQVRS